MLDWCGGSSYLLISLLQWLRWCHLLMQWRPLLQWPPRARLHLYHRQLVTPSAEERELHPTLQLLLLHLHHHHLQQLLLLPPQPLLLLLLPPHLQPQLLHHCHHQSAPPPAQNGGPGATFATAARTSVRFWTG